jgi:outer membrane protein
MKKITVFAIMMLTAFGAFAQFNKGRMLVGGSLEFQTTTNKYKYSGNTTTNAKQTVFSMQPQFGYFIIDNLAIGAGLNVSLSKYKADNSDYESTGTVFVFEPMVRYYLPQGIFFQGQFGIGTGKYKDNGNGIDEDKFTRTSFALGAGYAIFLNDNIAIEPIIGYGSTGDKDKDSKVKDVDNGIFIRVGIQAYLGNK